MEAPDWVVGFVGITISALVGCYHPVPNFSPRGFVGNAVVISDLDGPLVAPRARARSRDWAAGDRAGGPRWRVRGLAGRLCPGELRRQRPGGRGHILSLRMGHRVEPHSKWLALGPHSDRQRRRVQQQLHGDGCCLRCSACKCVRRARHQQVRPLGAVLRR